MANRTGRLYLTRLSGTALTLGGSLNVGGENVYGARTGFYWTAAAGGSLICPT